MLLNNVNNFPTQNGVLVLVLMIRTVLSSGGLPTVTDWQYYTTLMHRHQLIYYLIICPFFHNV